MNATEFREFVGTRFNGTLKAGVHEPNGQACILEARNVALNNKWTDAPGDFVDLRALNDAPWSSDAVRTKHILRVATALWDWPTWTDERKQKWAKTVAERTIREILPIAFRAFGMNEEADRCEREGSEAAARDAASYAARDAASYAARVAASTARYAARSDASDAASDAVLILACNIWCESAEVTA